MKILLISDTHYQNDILKKVVYDYKNKVDAIICCGDTSLDPQDYLLKDIKIIVKGNHDFYNDFPQFVIMNDILITHGHLYNVYYDYRDLIKLCHENHCHYCFHGHTHVPTHQYIEGIHFINPGSLMINRGSYGYGTFAIVDIQNDISVHFYHHQDYHQVDDEVLKEGLDTLEEFKQLIQKYENKQSR